MFPLANFLRLLREKTTAEKLMSTCSLATDMDRDIAHETPSPVPTQFAARKTVRSRPADHSRSADAATVKDRRQPSTSSVLFSDPPNALIFTGILFCAHMIGLILIFNPVDGLFNDQPLIDQDWGLHFHHLQSLANFWQGDHRFWGYNPFFMAGYPSNTIQDLSIKFFEFVSLVLSAVALSTVQWFKLSAFLSMASVPWMMYFAARNFFFAEDLKQVTAVAAALLGTIYWWNSLPREMFFYGMIGFPVASYLSLWGVSLFYRMANHTTASVPVHLGWWLFALIILPLHVQSMVVFVPPLVAMVILQTGRLQRNLLLTTIGAIGFSLLVNSYWLMPALDHRGDDVSKAIVDQLPLFAESNPFTFLIDYLGIKGYWTFRPSFFEKGFRLTLLILGLLGVIKLIRSDKRILGITLATAIAVLFFISYFGALISSFRALQPLRFKVPLDVFLVIGAAASVSDWFARGATKRLRLVPLLMILGVATFVINLGQTESTGRLRLRSRLAPELNSIVEWIRRETPVDARVMFEESGDETGFVYDGVYLSAFLPQLTERQMIGGPINLYNDRHHFAEFHSGRLFKRDIATFSDAELRNYLSLYNIGAVVAFHTASLKRFQSMSGLFTLDRRIGPVQLLKVKQPLSWFIEGEGKVKASLNRIEITEIKGNVIILKYHWIVGLKSEPAVKIEPVKLADDPIPFIKIIDPPAALVLRSGS